MKRLLAFLLMIALGSGIEAASLSIAKRVRIDLGPPTYPLGASNSFDAAYPMRDGGFVLVGPAVSTNSPWQRFSSSGGIIWSNSLPIGRPNELVELESGEIACLGGRGPMNTLFVISADGSGLNEHTLPKPSASQNNWDALDYTTLLAQTNGILGGGFGDDRSSYHSNFVMKLSTNFTKLWQRDYGVFRYGYRPMAKLASDHEGGYLFAYNGYEAPGTQLGSGFGIVHSEVLGGRFWGAFSKQKTAVS